MSARSSLQYDLASTTGFNDPNIFVNRNWLTINDDIQNYSAHQSRFSTSSISASKFINWSTGYIDVPLMLNMVGNLSPATATSSCDFALALKNGFHSMVHSIQISINGNSVINATPHINMWNNFKLMQNLSFNELKTLSHIGFYPPNRRAFVYQSSASVDGIGTCLNRNAGAFDVVSGAHASAGTYNDGMVERQHAIVYDADGLTAPSASAFSTLLTKNAVAQMYKSHVFNKVNDNTNGCYQLAVSAQIPLKNLHSIFEQLPLIRSMFMEIVISWNQTSHTISVGSGGSMTCTDALTTSPLGGVSPLLFASKNTGSGNASTLQNNTNYTISINVGNKPINNTVVANPNVVNSPLNQQCTLHLESLTMSPNYESAYLKDPVKEVYFEDVYSYQVKNIASQGTFDQLISVGLAGLQSILIIPYYTSSSNGSLSPIYSPFSEEGASTGSPLAHIREFQVKVAGENQLMKTSAYTYETYLEQLHGERSINSNLTSGLGSGLVSKEDFELFPNYYCNLSYMHPNDVNIPKSVSIQGLNASAKPIDLYVFVSFKRRMKVDSITGMVLE